MIGFDDEQLAQLRAPLAREVVKGRKQAGREVSYIEGWHVIAEANRIFGFDGWDRETIDCRCVSEREVKMGQNKDRDGWRVAYVGKVRVTVRAGDRVVVREGTGYGSGIDADIGEAHESAIKECETDSAKRALMTFGNPFGLALYDKTQAEVEPKSGARPPPQPRGVAPPEYGNTKAAPSGYVNRTTAFPINAEGDPSPPIARTPTAVEPPAITERRSQLIEGWWAREHYGIDPDVVDGGLTRWDYWYGALVDAAPSLDALTKLMIDNQPNWIRWRGTVAEPVERALKTKVGARERALRQQERAA